MSLALRGKQLFAWILLGLFLAGFFSPIGAVTGPILGIWFIGTQKPRQGFVGLFLIAFIISLLHHARSLFAAPSVAFTFLICLILASVLDILPFTLHRLLSPRLPALASTLPYPIAHSALLWATAALLQAPVAAALRPHAALFPASLTLYAGIPVFAVDWCAAALVHGWNHGFSPAAWTFSRPGRHRHALRSGDLALLRSISAGEPLQFTPARDALISPSGERFPIHDGIPSFLRPQDLTGANRKYNQLYETIGGFYDDSQRVACALAGMDRDAYVMSYLASLEVRNGDTVLETSVGTGLNFKCLPRDIRRFGLDLSAEMLAACRENLARWQMDAALVLGNAEALPFADSSFDCVFHVGGINFFSDREAAIREMIRVARPGSLLLIADETEEHVKSAYEQIPLTREYFKNRTSAISAPVDLIPANMLDVRLRILRVGRKNRFYALTFRKPPEPSAAPVPTLSAAVREPSTV